jgi:AcrR family transcriptional regulator
MAATRRPGDESKVLLIEAAVEIIRTEGYGALCARRLAERVGLKRQIVHYYFGTIDDLLLAVVRHYGDSSLARYSAAFESYDDPLRVVWETHGDESSTAFAFMAMASHHALVRAEIRRYLDKQRAVQVEALSRHFEQLGVKPRIPPVAMVLLLQSVSQTLSAERELGAARGHVETTELMQRLLQRLGDGGDIESNAGAKRPRTKSVRGKR